MLKTQHPAHTLRVHIVKKNAQITMTAQMPFSIANIDNQQLLGAPALYKREGQGEPFEYPKIDEFTDTYTLYCSTDVRHNDHGQRYNYITASQELLFKSAHAEYRFNLNKFGNQVTYSTNSPGASVTANPWIFDDFSMKIQLEMREPGTKADRKTDKTNRRLEAQTDDQVLQYASNDPVHPAPQKKASQVVIKNTDKFSLLFNVNLYFSGCDVYQEFPPGEMHKVDKRAGASTDCYLTPEKGYPPGVTTLTIKDGFSEATAIVKFDHDASKKQVTMTIESFTSKLCDIRDFSLSNKPFPNAICIAL